MVVVAIQELLHLTLVDMVQVLPGKATMVVVVLIVLAVRVVVVAVQVQSDQVYQLDRIRLQDIQVVLTVALDCNRQLPAPLLIMLVAVVAVALTKAQKAATAATVAVVVAAPIQVEQILRAVPMVAAPGYRAGLLAQAAQILVAVAVAVMAVIVSFTTLAEQVVRVSWLFVILILILLQPPPPDHQQSL